MAEPSDRSTPAALYRLVGREPTGFGFGGRRLSPFVGRDHELNLLLERVRQIESGRGHVMGISGEAGIGKSRLAYELRERLANLGVPWLEGRCVSHGTAVPYLPLIDLLRRAWQLDEMAPPEHQAATVRSRLGGLDLDLDQQAPYLLRLLGLAVGTETLTGLSPEGLKRGTLDALRRAILAMAKRTRLVLLVEDLHWVDRSSEDFLLSLVDALPGTPILLTTTARSGYQPPWLNRSYASQLTLLPLSTQDTRRLIDTILMDRLVDEPLLRELAARGEGNPFFLEELTSALGDGLDGSTQNPGAIPATVRDALASRMDRLAPTSRYTLDTASILGREVPRRLLEALLPGTDLEPALRDLVAQELLYEGSRMWVFKHALTQEVAYDRLDPVVRRRLHAAAGTAYEEFWRNGSDEVLDRLAHHFARSGNRQQAVHYLVRFGEQLTARHALPEALVALSEALEEARRLPGEEGDDAVLRILEYLTVVLVFLGRPAESVERLEQEGPRYSRSTSAAQRGRYHAWLAAAAVHVGHYQLVETSGMLAVELADHPQEARTRAVASWALATLCFFQGRHAEGLTHGQRAVDSLAPRRPRAWLDQFWLGFGNWILAWNAMVCGDHARADAAAADTARIGEETDDRRVQSYGLATQAWCAALAGDPDRARSLVQRATGLNADPLVLAVVATLSGCALYEGGDPSGALAAVQPAQEQFKAFAMQNMAAWAAAILAEATLALGRPKEAHAWATAAIHDGADAPFPYAAALGRRSIGRLASETGRVREALADLRQALEGFASMGARFEWARTLVDLARVSHAHEQGEAATYLSDARHAFAQVGARSWEQHVSRVAGDLGLTLAEKDNPRRLADSTSD